MEFNEFYKANRKEVQKPGIRGGIGYFNQHGHWHYGTRPLTKPQHLPEEGDLALTITKHIEPYIQNALDNPVSPSYLRKYKEDAREVEQELSKFIPGNYIPKLIGAGGNAVAVQLSSNLVARIEREDFHEDRPNFPWMLQPIEQGHNGNLWWEILPKVEVAVDTSTKKTYSQEGRDLLNPPPKIQNDIDNLSKEAAKDGYEFSDEHAGNIGYVNGRPVIIDPGAVTNYNPIARNTEYDLAETATSKVKPKWPSKTKDKPENLEASINSNIAAVKQKGYKVVDKTIDVDPILRAETWKAVNAVTDNVEQVLPEIKDIMARQPLVINVTSASVGGGVRGEHHQPLYAGAANSIDINAEYSRTFMHELGHYLDSAAAILHPSGQWDYRHKLSTIYNTPIFNLVTKLKDFPEYKQWIQERPKNERNYWTSNPEVFGRFFDQYMYHKLGKPPSDSYEPYTNQELEEAGKLLEEGLSKLKLINTVAKSFTKFIGSWTKAFETTNKPNKAIGIPTIKSLLSYGIEPIWVQDLFKAVKIIKPKAPNVTYNKTQLGGKFSIPETKSPLHYTTGPESEAEQESAIGTEGGKYYVDKYGKKHYGPYGTQPAKHLKVTATEQPYIHEQAEPVPPPSPPKEPEKPKTLEEEIADFKAKGNGTTIDFIMEYGKTHHDEVVATMMSGSTFKFTYKLSDKLKEAGYNDIDTDPVALNNALLYSIPTAERKAIRTRIKFLEETNSDTIYKRVSEATKTTINSILASSKSDTETTLLIADLADRMVGTANADTGFGLSDEQKKELTKKYKAYLTNRINEAKEMRKNIKIFSHTIQVADSPAKPPIDVSKDPDTWKNSGPDVEKRIREDHPENQTREDWKIMVSKQIGKRMIDLGITTEMANDYFATLNHYPRSSTDDIRISAADDMVASWASSADGSNALSLAIQRLTSEVFPGAAKWDTIQPWNGKSAWDWSTKYLDNPVFKQVATAFLYAQYQNTQDYFKKLGVTQVTIGRGCKTTFEPIGKEAEQASSKAKESGSNKWVVSGTLDEDKHVTNPLSSWGWSSATNSNFSGGSGLPSADQEGQPVVIAATVPVSRVLGGFFSGDGCENEHEVILIGSEKPVDKLYWAAWNDEVGDYGAASDTAVSVAQKILEGNLPDTDSMGFVTPAMKFRQNLTQELIGNAGENWSKLSDTELETKVKAVYGVTKGKTIPLGDGSSIGVKQAITIVHDLINQGYGLSTGEAVDKLVLNGGLKSLLNSWYTTDEDKWMGKFEATTAKTILQELVNNKIISQEDLSSAAAYLNQKVKQQVEEGNKTSTKLADTTPNKIVYAKTKEFLNKEENKGIVQGIATGISQGLPYDADSFVKGYLFEAIAKHMGLEKGDVNSIEANLPSSKFSQSVKDAFQDAVEEYTGNNIDTKLATDLEKHTKAYISKNNSNIAELSDKAMTNLTTDIAQDFQWVSNNKHLSSSTLENLTKPILTKMKSEAKDNIESLTGPKLDAHVEELLKNPNVFKTSALSGKFVSFIDVLTMSEDVTNSLMKEAGLDPDTTPYYKKLKDAVKLRLRKEYKKQLQEAYNKGLPIPPGAEAILGKD